MSQYSDLVPVTDHTTQALTLLIEQYQGLPRLTGLVSSYVNRVQELENVLWDVINKRLLDYTDANGNPAHAVAAQLDAIGRLVGRGRNGQSDATYLIYIRAQIFLNKSRARRGDMIGLLNLVQSADFTPGIFTYSESYPCAVIIEFSTAPQTSPLILLGILQLCVTGGVRVHLISPPQPDAATVTFALSNEGASSVPARGFGSDGSSLYGGVLASELA